MTLDYKEPDPQCNKLNKVRFRFEFESTIGREKDKKKGAPCRGFIVQKVTVVCKASMCDFCLSCRKPGTPPPKDAPTFSYWEAFYVTKGQTLVLDNAYVPSCKDSCGYYRQTGEVRFYCMRRVDVPSTGGDKVGTGDLRKKWPPGASFNAKGGDVLCITRAGGLPATDDYDKVKRFWEKGPVEGPAIRSYTLDWDCCESGGKKAPLLKTTPPK